MSDDDLPVLGYRLRDLDERVLRHPADRAATAALKKVPGLSTVIKKLGELGYERAFRQQLLSSAVRIGTTQLPEVWSRHQSAYTTLALDRTPELYLVADPRTNAAAFGSSDPVVMVNSQAIDQLDDAQQRVVFAHEAAHVMCDHMTYQTALVLIAQLSASVIGRATPAMLPLIAVRSALLEWSRAAELTCDRIAALAVRDPLVVCRTLMAVSGGTAGDRLSLDAFLAQAHDYGKRGFGLLNRFSRMSLELNSTHPLSVRRAHELMAWVQSGEYERIRDGSYPKRGETPDPSLREEARGAAEHYGERVQGAFKDFAGQAEEATKAVSDWLSKNLGDEPRDRGGS